MKPENKLPVLDLISAGMKTVVNTLQPDLPPWPATGTIAEQRQYYTLERRFWNAGAPEMATRATWFQQNTGRWKHVSFVRSQIARRRYFICMEAVLFSAISIPTIASCACWQATANVR
ncbi:acetyl esterase [Escherichia coli]|uniref:Acetyl esterase n=1 Tax=Escherichia coli TaxID=562 RepID=A0A377B2W8_ECOLX|nr:acetyl esterase [Escherichia coli]